MKSGDNVKMAPMWKHDVAYGVIEKLTADYVVVKWTGIPGQWHYTKDQAQRLEIINETS